MHGTTVKKKEKEKCYLHILLYFLITSSGIGIKITLESDDCYMK